MDTRTRTKRTNKFWLAIIIVNVIILFALAAARNYLYVKSTLIPKVEDVVIGIQKAPTTVNDWYTVTNHPEQFNPNGIVHELLNVFVNNYQEYNNAAYTVSENNITYVVYRDGDKAWGFIDGSLFYAYKTDSLVDFYVLRDECWFHYQQENSLVFCDFKYFADVISTLTFEKLPYGYRYEDAGWLFSRYSDNCDDQGLDFEVLPCGHLRRIGYQNVRVSEIKFIGTAVVQECPVTDEDNIIEVNSIDDILDFDNLLNLTQKRGLFSLDGLTAEEIVSTTLQAMEDNWNIGYSTYLHMKSMYMTFSGGALGFNNELVDITYCNLVYDKDNNSATYLSSPSRHFEATITLLDEDLAYDVFDEIIMLHASEIENAILTEFDNGQYWSAKLIQCTDNHNADEQALSEYCLYVSIEKVEGGYKIVWKDVRYT